MSQFLRAPSWPVTGLLLASLFVADVLAAPQFPVLTDRVVDQANILSATTEVELKALLKAHETETSNQIVVVTLKSLDGYAIDDYGYQLGRHWGIGQAEHDNGALLIIAPNERKVRIEVGYGLEGTLTDALSSYIINNDIVPWLKIKDFDTGAKRGIEAMLLALQQEPNEYNTFRKSRKKSGGGSSIFTLFPLFIPLIFIGELFSSRTRGNLFRSLSISGFFGLLAWAITTSIMISLGVFAVMFLISMFSRGGGGGGLGSGNGGVYFPGGFGGGGFGGGGFGGGGGSFGGGGASGGW